MQPGGHSTAYAQDAKFGPALMDGSIRTHDPAMSAMPMRLDTVSACILFIKLAR